MPLTKLEIDVLTGEVREVELTPEELAELPLPYSIPADTLPPE